MFHRSILACLTLAASVNFAVASDVLGEWARDDGKAKVRFAPPIGSIKKCIEGLIEKAYIERDAKVRDEYLYVA